MLRPMIWFLVMVPLVLLAVLLAIHHRRAHRWDARWREHIQVLKTDTPLNLSAVVPFRVTRRKRTRKKVSTAVADLSAERAKRRR